MTTDTAAELSLCMNFSERHLTAAERLHDKWRKAAARLSDNAVRRGRNKREPGNFSELATKLGNL